MSYRVVLQRAAMQDLSAVHAWAAERAPLAADRWLTRFDASLQTLQNDPERRPLARENGKLDVELRELLFGKAPYLRLSHHLYHRRRHGADSANSSGSTPSVITIGLGEVA